MNGQVTVTSERGNVRTRQIQQGPSTETNNPYLQGVYINNNTINVAVLVVVQLSCFFETVSG